MEGCGGGDVGSQMRAENWESKDDRGGVGEAEKKG